MQMFLSATGSLYLRFLQCTGIFDGTSCNVIPETASYGGGSTFDCYSSRTNFSSLPVAGIGISAWCIGDGQWGGDNFDWVDPLFEDPLTSSFAGKGLSYWRYE